ncbi:hypothetical protein WMZ97_10625 [Lentibacillus sp. N15]
MYVKYKNRKQANVNHLVSTVELASAVGQIQGHTPEKDINPLKKKKITTGDLLPFFVNLSPFDPFYSIQAAPFSQLVRSARVSPEQSARWIHEDAW